MSVGEGPVRRGNRLQSVLSRTADGCFGQCVRERVRGQIHDSGDEVVEAFDVFVEAGRRDAQGLRQAGKGEGAQALGVDDASSFPRHGFRAEPRPRHAFVQS